MTYSSEQIRAIADANRLSDIQTYALARACGTGLLCRWPGGYWTDREKELDDRQSPDWYVGTSTVTSLIRKELLVGTLFMRRGEPWEVEPTDKARALFAPE